MIIDVDVTQIIIIVGFILVGSIAGLMSGFLGTGGGLVVVPAISPFLVHFGLEENVMYVATATSLAVMCITTMSGAIAHARFGHLHKELTTWLVIGTLLGCVSGRQIAPYAPDRFVVLLFVSTVAVVMALLIKGRKKQIADKIENMPSKAALVAYSGLVGCLGSMIGIGSGSLLVPWLLHEEIPAKTAVSAAVVCSLTIAMGSTAAGLIYSYKAGFTVNDSFVFKDNLYGPILVIPFISASIGSYLAAPLGAALTRSVCHSIFKKIFMLLLPALAAYMFFKVG